MERGCPCPGSDPLPRVRAGPQVLAVMLVGAGGAFSSCHHWGQAALLPLPGAARLQRLPPLSSVNAGLALKSEECFAGAAFWAGSRAQSVQSPWQRAVRPHGGRQEQAGSLGWAHRGWAGAPSAEGNCAVPAGRARACGWPGRAPWLSRSSDGVACPAAAGRGSCCFQGRQLLAASLPWQAVATGATALKCLC